MPPLAPLCLKSTTTLTINGREVKRIFKAAVVQLKLDDNETRADRLTRVEKILAKIYRQEEQYGIIMLPEIWATGFFNFHRYVAESELLEGETYTRLAHWAKKVGSYLLAGSIVEREGDKYYNTSLLIDPAGRLVGKYRKMHLFGYQSLESNVLTPGKEVFTLETEFGTWGITTCYDLRFPELYRKMVEDGVETLFIIAAWPLARLQHWILFNRVRALENLCYLASCNCVGSLGGNVLGGHSMVVDPWGEVLAEAGEEEEILSAEIDLEKLVEIRSQFPALRDRKIL